LTPAVNGGLADKYIVTTYLRVNTRRIISSQKVVTKQQTTHTTFFHATVAEKRWRTRKS